MGKHAVLRFVCDFPEDETHSDIPDWLMSKTGDGVYYEMTNNADVLNRITAWYENNIANDG